MVTHRLRKLPFVPEQFYQVFAVMIQWMNPLIKRMGYNRVARFLTPIERASKSALFGCQMCGQCTLHSTGMVCPMTCPKHLRNGACGGVRDNCNCEVIPEMKCVWVVAYERAREMRVYGPELISIRPPMNHQLKGTSAWINMLTGADKSVPDGWNELSASPVIHKSSEI